MKVLITNGTTEFLKTIQEKHPEANVLIMENPNGAIAYYEGNNTDIFATEREYETVDMVGDMKSDGFVVMNNIPVTDEGRPIFEDRFKNRQGKIEEMPGFQALRILRPEQGNTYIVLSQWSDETSFINWHNSESFQKAHGKNNEKAKNEERPSYSAGTSYVTQYSMVK